jgi:hypothetical protein
MISDCRHEAGFRLEHVEQITGNANEVEFWSWFDQPTKPVKPEMNVGGDKDFHDSEKCFV